MTVVALSEQDTGRLEGGGVQIWSAGLDVMAERLDALESCLSPDELARAARFRFARDRTRYVAGRGILRSLLGGLLGQPADELVFAYTHFGKPFLDGEDGLCFNVSHSGGFGLFALGWNCDLGVDVEAISSRVCEERVAEHFFAKREVAALRSLPAEEQPRAFLRCWTRKEAYIKARGEGLSLPLHDFEVSLVPDAPALLHTAWSRDEPAEWSFRDLSHLCPDHVAALAMRERKIEGRPRSAPDTTKLFERKELGWQN